MIDIENYYDFTITESERRGYKMAVPSLFDMGSTTTVPNVVYQQLIALHISQEMFAHLKQDLTEYHEIQKWLRCNPESYHDFKKFEMVEILKR